MPRITKIPHEETIGKTLMLLTQTARLINKYMETYFYHKTRLSFTKFMALKMLSSRAGTMTPTQLAEWTQTELHNITTLVDRLKKDGLVYTEHSDVDRRKVNVCLTDKGRKALDQAMPVANVLIDKIMTSITEKDALKLDKILELLRDNAYVGLESIAKDA